MAACSCTTFGTRALLAHLKPPRPVETLTFTPDGLRLVSKDREGKVLVWQKDGNGEWAPGLTITADPAFVGWIPSAAFPFFVPHLVRTKIAAIAITPDGKELCACVNASPLPSSTARAKQALPALAQSRLNSFHLPTTIALWNLSDGTRTARSFLAPTSDRCDRLAISPDGKFLAAIYFRRKDERVSVAAVARTDFSQGVLVWRLDTGELARDLSGNSWITVCFSPDGRFLACSGEGVDVFDTANFQRHLFTPGEVVASTAFVPDQQLLAIASACLGRIRLWDITTNRDIAVLEHVSTPPDYAHFSVLYNSGRHTLVAASRRAIRMWNLAGAGEKRTLKGHRKAINGVAFSPDGKLLASAGSDHAVRIWDPDTGHLRKERTGFGYGVPKVVFSRDGKRLATAHRAGAIQIWDVEKWQELAAPTDLLGHFVCSVALSPDGRYFAAGACDQGGVTLWRVEPNGVNRDVDGRLRLQLIARPANHVNVWNVCFSPDSELLAWVEAEEFRSTNNTLHLWEMATSRERSFPPARLAGFQLAFHPSDKHVYFVADTAAPGACDVTTGQRTYLGAGPSRQRSEIAALGGQIALSSDGAWLAAAHGNYVSIWDTASEQLLLKLPEEQSSILSLDWSPNRDLAIGSMDGGLVIWNLPKIKAQLDEIGLGW